MPVEVAQAVDENEETAEADVELVAETEALTTGVVEAKAVALPVSDAEPERDGECESVEEAEVLKDAASVLLKDAQDVDESDGRDDLVPPVLTVRVGVYDTVLDCVRVRVELYTE